VLLARHLGPPPVQSHTSGRTTPKGEDQPRAGRMERGLIILAGAAGGAGANLFSRPPVLETGRLRRRVPPGGCSAARVRRYPRRISHEPAAADRRRRAACRGAAAPSSRARALNSLPRPARRPRGSGSGCRRAAAGARMSGETWRRGRPHIDADAALRAPTPGRPADVVRRRMPAVNRADHMSHGGTEVVMPPRRRRRTRGRCTTTRSMSGQRRPGFSGDRHGPGTRATAWPGLRPAQAIAGRMRQAEPWLILLEAAGFRGRSAMKLGPTARPRA
jgi:hypothetical protein